MPLGLGLAVSHSPLFYRPRERWEDIYQRLILDVPQDTRAEVETPEVLDDYARRVDAGFDALQARLRDYKPDALVVAFSDNGRVFGQSHVPQLSVLVGPEIWGTTHYAEIGEEPSDDAKVTIPVHQPVAAWLVDELTEEGFDMNVNRFFKPLGDPENGAPHSLTSPYMRIAADIGVPVVPLFINSEQPPTITGERMPPLGRAVARVLSERDERIAILGVGGLSGDPQGYLAGWIDELMDNWITSRVRRGRSEQLKTMWDVDSITTRGATRTVRNWIAVGSAMEAVGAKAEVLDYIRFHHATVGTAFAVWEPK